MNYTMMHGSTNIKFAKFLAYKNISKLQNIWSLQLLHA